MFQEHQREQVKNIHIQEVWPKIIQILSQIDEKHSLSKNSLYQHSGSSFNSMVGLILGVADAGGRDAYIQEGLENASRRSSPKP
jgi:hypothetical protein